LSKFGCPSKFGQNGRDESRHTGCRHIAAEEHECALQEKSAAEYDHNLADLREYDLVVEDDLQPIRSLDVNLLIALVQPQCLEQMLLLGCSQDLRMLGKVWHQPEDQKRDADCDKAFENEDPSPAFSALNPVHFTNAVRQQATEAWSQESEGEEHGVTERCLLAGIVLCK
jgi:hypothetical protein